MTDALTADVAVVGGGNAALAAALAAAEGGARVRLLEAAPEAERGGNSAYTAGAMRVVFDDTEALAALMPDLTERERAETEFGAYTTDDYFDDMGRLTHYRADPDLVEQLVELSHPTLLWLRKKGVRFQPSYGRQAFKSGGRFRFWGGLAVEAWGGGPGLIEALYRAAADAGVAVHYEAEGYALLTDDAGFRGVRRADQRTLSGHRRAGRGARERRFRGQRRVACTLSRPRLGSRQGARDPLQPGRRDSHGAGGRRHARRKLVRMPRGRLGQERAALRRSCCGATGSRSTATPSPSWSIRPENASSTRAPTSATTPTRPTDDGCWNSRDRRRGRCSMRKRPICCVTNTASAA